MRQARVVQKYGDAEVLAVMMRHQPYASKLLSDASASPGRDGLRRGSCSCQQQVTAHRLSGIQVTSSFDGLTLSSEGCDKRVGK